MEKGSHRTTINVANEGQGLGESLDFRMRYLGFKITGSPKFLNTGMGSPHLTCRNHQGGVMWRMDGRQAWRFPQSSSESCWFGDMIVKTPSPWHVRKMHLAQPMSIWVRELP